tara:strand:- start:1508 stop:1630 length:123 start_codon:yes stop_codon:yes gene_type:complete
MFDNMWFWIKELFVDALPWIIGIAIVMVSLFILSTTGIFN